MVQSVQVSSPCVSSRSWRGRWGCQHARGSASSAADDSHGRQAADRPRARRRRRRGLAHIGVLRWFEEHRIPIDVISEHQHGRADRRRVRVGS